MDFKELKDSIKLLLTNKNIDKLVELSQTNKRVASALIAFSYEKDSELSWRAIEAVGRIIGTMPEEEGRKQVRRLLWNATDESGTVPWSVPEILGEVICTNPTPFEDIVPILIGYAHSETEDNIFLPGVIYALGRIGQEHPRYISSYAELIVRNSLSHKDAQVCANACIAVKRMALTDVNMDKPRKRTDTATVFYQDRIMSLSIGGLVELLETETNG
ncbi:DVU0298 family protein [Candidatus Magnetobacterium casense]|uniref:DVU0298 family protein n=1 Tax=Candidatus Magnetobacterium casense TaxID=1455061 RepID=UPI000698535A|nr:DVU0298 family protein [Candidatus Magnetobacterium casensis]